VSTTTPRRILDLLASDRTFAHERRRPDDPRAAAALGPVPRAEDAP